MNAFDFDFEASSNDSGSILRGGRGGSIGNGSNTQERGFASLTTIGVGVGIITITLLGLLWYQNQKKKGQKSGNK